MYHISLEMEKYAISIYDSLICKFTDLHVFIPHTNSGSLTTPMGIHVEYIKCTQINHHQF
jgi:hypothetical protein